MDVPDGFAAIPGLPDHYYASGWDISNAEGNWEHSGQVVTDVDAQQWWRGPVDPSLLATIFIVRRYHLAEAVHMHDLPGRSLASTGRRVSKVVYRDTGRVSYYDGDDHLGDVPVGYLMPVYMEGDDDG